MHITAQCVLEREDKKVDISIDLDYVETMSDVYKFADNEPEASGTSVKEILNEDDIQAALDEKYDLGKVNDAIAWANV